MSGAKQIKMQIKEKTRKQNLYLFTLQVKVKVKQKVINMLEAKQSVKRLSLDLDWNKTCENSRLKCLKYVSFIKTNINLVHPFK